MLLGFDQTVMLILLCATILDRLIGDPHWLWSRIPHPVVLIGKVIDALRKTLCAGRFQKGKGFLALGGLIMAALVWAWLISFLPWWGELLVVAIFLAYKSLKDHIAEVAQGLHQSPQMGRAAVSKIVGRDTMQMDESDVARAAIESGAENFSDGFIAPAFWYLLLGMPGLLVYKAINTADSMIGYKTPELADFGYASAKCDDLLNFVPARLTAMLIYLTQGRLPSWANLTKEARKHRSPNAGWPEAAIADIMQIALSGPRKYHGIVQAEPWINERGLQHLNRLHINAALRILERAWLLCLGLIGLAGVIHNL